MNQLPQGTFQRNVRPYQQYQKPGATLNRPLNPNQAIGQTAQVPVQQNGAGMGMASFRPPTAQQQPVGQIASQGQAGPQVAQENGIPTNNPSMPQPQQQMQSFIQNAVSAGIDKNLIMTFIQGKLGLQQQAAKEKGAVKRESKGNNRGR